MTTISFSAVVIVDLLRDLFGTKALKICGCITVVAIFTIELILAIIICHLLAEMYSMIALCLKLGCSLIHIIFSSTVFYQLIDLSANRKAFNRR